jgi:hypothetical protein
MARGFRLYMIHDCVLPDPRVKRAGELFPRGSVSVWNLLWRNNYDTIKETTEYPLEYTGKWAVTYERQGEPVTLGTFETSAEGIPYTQHDIEKKTGLIGVAGTLAVWSVWDVTGKSRTMRKTTGKRFLFPDGGVLPVMTEARKKRIDALTMAENYEREEILRAIRHGLISERPELMDDLEELEEELKRVIENRKRELKEKQWVGASDFGVLGNDSRILKE